MRRILTNRVNSPSLIVPVHLDTLVVNSSVKARDGDFHWWRFNYNALGDYLSPKPLPGNLTFAMKEGIYLHWTLPQALRHGSQDKITGQIEYPQVPNRWLVVRMQGKQKRVAKAWVIESDCPFSKGVQTMFPKLDATKMSMYLLDPAVINAWENSSDPLRNSFTPAGNSPDFQVTTIGVPFPLSDGWKERSTDTSFLTAVAPGNAEFSIYYPHNNGIFSMYDDLDGLAITQDTISYQVVGWFSNPDDDIMSSWSNDTISKDPYATLLNQLGWKVAGSPTGKATESYYQGMTLNIDWDLSGTAPPDDPLPKTQHSNLNVSIGNTTIDAFTALVENQLKPKGYSDQTIKLLQAFQYDLLSVINQVNGDAILKEEIKKAWFGSEEGGYRWSIIEKKSEGAIGTVLTSQEETWLLQLNKDQLALDEALFELYELQWLLNAAWWKAGRLPNLSFNTPNITEKQLDTFLDPVNTSGITGQVLSKLLAIETLLTKVPGPAWKNAKNPQEAYQNGILNFALGKNLNSSKTLKSSTMPRYWKSNDPVIFISGVAPAPANNPNEELQVRISTDIASSLKINTKTVDAAILGAALPVLQKSSGLPSVIPALMTEFFLVDPASAAAIGSAISIPVSTVTPVIEAHNTDDYGKKPLPAIGLDKWQQPWNPMYMEWTVDYLYIPYESNSKRNWSFDGTEYQYTPVGGAPKTEMREIGGISLLSPHTKFVFKSKLDEFIKKYPDADLSDLESEIDNIDHWEFLAQEMTGFNELLTHRSPSPFRRPGPGDTLGTGNAKVPVAPLAGFPTQNSVGHNLPSAFQGKVNTKPSLPDVEDITLHGVRQGQFFFTSLKLYDKFGRALHVVEKNSGSGLYDSQNFPVIMDPALKPEKKVATKPASVASVMQLPPRILQNAKLDFQLVDGKDQSKVLGLDAGVNPIAGWVLPNHLANSILIYGPEGTSLGEFSLFVQSNGSKLGQWLPPAHNDDIKTMNDVGTVSPILKQMLESANLKNQENFETFLQVIDETLWTLDPLGNRDDQNLSVLIGRPLAIVRSKLQFELHGPARRTPDWDQTLNPPAPAFIDYDFGIRFGDQATREDGVIGYFLDTNYETFNSVAGPQTTASQNYVDQIGPVGTPNGNFINLAFNKKSEAYVSLLVDPRASIHAVTGILPIKKMEIPATFIEKALSNMEVGFRLGPLVTNVQKTPVQGGEVPAHPTAILYPAPAEQNGTWSWWEGDINGGQPWVGYDLIKATPNANLKGIPNSLREGILQLKIDLNKGS